MPNRRIYEECRIYKTQELLYLTLRYLFGREGNMLVAGVVAADATRTTAVDIEAHLKALMLAL